MKIVVANQVVPDSHYVYDINLIQMSYGLASLGHKVTLIGLQDERGIIPGEEIDEIYGIEPNLEWVQLGTFGINRKLLTRNARLFSWVGYRYAIKLGADCIYARDYLFPWYCARNSIPTYTESHAHPENDTPEFRKLIAASQLPAFRCWLTISTVLVDGYKKRGVPEEKLLILPSAVNFSHFGRPDVLPPSPYGTSSPNVVYTGRLIDENGIPEVLKAAALLQDVCFHLVGGNLADIKRHEITIKRNGLKNIKLHGIKKHSEIPSYLWHADALILPYSSRHPNNEWACPLKMVEYLASGRPIVATDTRMLRNWLKDEEVVYVKPDDGQAMAEGIRHLLVDRDLQRRLSESGIIRAKSLSFRERARKMLAHNAFNLSTGD